VSLPNKSINPSKVPKPTRQPLRAKHTHLHFHRNGGRTRGAPLAGLCSVRDAALHSHIVHLFVWFLWFCGFDFFMFSVVVVVGRMVKVAHGLVVVVVVLVVAVAVAADYLSPRFLVKDTPFTLWPFMAAVTLRANWAKSLRITSAGSFSKTSMGLGSLNKKSSPNRIIWMV